MSRFLNSKKSLMIACSVALAYSTMLVVLVIHFLF
jgi:hypothetical protein